MATFRTTVKKDFREKDGTQHTTGDQVTIYPLNNFECTVFNQTNKSNFKMKLQICFIFFKGFERITNKRITGMLFNSTCLSLIGDEVEPDGHDVYGFPSLLLNAGMV